MVKTALLVIDVQNDFCPPDGSLKVEGGVDIIPIINAMREQRDWDLVVLSKDWHPRDHVSFFSNHKEDSSAQLFAPLKLSNGSMQMMWPDHCVQGSYGSHLHKDLIVKDSDVIVHKGTNKEIDSYSGFFDNEHKNETEMHSILQKHEITDIVVVGLAFDYCVGYTALDGKMLGYNVKVVESATRSVDKSSEISMAQKLSENGIEIRKQLWA